VLSLSFLFMHSLSPSITFVLSLLQFLSCSLSLNPFHALSLSPLQSLSCSLSFNSCALSLSIFFMHSLSLSLSFNPFRARSHSTHSPLNNSLVIDGSITLIYSQSIAQSLILIISLARDNTS
jgi:hypothetical protein